MTDTNKARPLDEWHEDMGPVVWWFFPVAEASWIGTPNDSDWPGYHTHFTDHPKVPENMEEINAAQENDLMVFDKDKCKVGGAFCGAWEDWFMACDNADPAAIKEERDPIHIIGQRVKRSECVHKESCPLYAKSTAPAAG